MNQDINIFVSNRIDLNSIQVDNPIYIPVYCGAVYKDKFADNFFMRDDTGDNISKKRNSYCEFTVQYWAWKNVVSEYYGLCHYRRYLSFSSRIYSVDMLGQVVENFLDYGTEQKYKLLANDYMRSVIKQYDAVVNKAVNITDVPTPNGKQTTVYGHWAAHDKVFIDKRTLPILLDTIQKEFPDYFEAANEYLYGQWHRGYNCYIMKADLFNAMCNFQFRILSIVENILYNSDYIGKCERTMGSLGEILYGIYIYYLKRQDKYKIKELQRVYFEETEKITVIDKIIKYILFTFKHVLESFGYMTLPKASKRRNFVKKYYFKLLGK